MILYVISFLVTICYTNYRAQLESSFVCLDVTWSIENMKAVCTYQNNVNHSDKIVFPFPMLIRTNKTETIQNVKGRKETPNILIHPEDGYF